MSKRFWFVIIGLLFSTYAKANSPYDGAYGCAVYVPEFNFSFYSYAVFLTKADGVTAATSVLTPVLTEFPTYGYSFGALNGSIYTGVDSVNGKSISLVFTGGNSATVNGYIRINNNSSMFSGNCVRVF